jgi:predicted phage terminase large subunit-like protein
MPQESEVEKRRRLAEASLPYFFRLIQDDGYIDDVHIELGRFIQAEVESGKTSRVLLIMPRGSYKTTFITKFFPLWLAVKNPNIRILVVSNTLPNAKQKVSEIRSIITEHPIINALWPHIIPNIHGKIDRWSDTSATLNRTGTYSEGTFESAGTRSRLTGRHYDWIIEDDTVAPDLDDVKEDVVVPSRSDIEQAIGWHKLATPLLIDPHLGGRVVVGTRWCHEDLIEYVEKKEPSYAVFSRKAIENGKPIVSKFNMEALEDIKVSLGSYMFSALYMNDPMRPDDMIFRSEWIIEMDSNDIPRDDEKMRWIITVDPAISERSEACDTVILRAGHLDGRIYVDQCLAGHYTPEQTITKILDLIELDVEKTKWVGIESVAYQKALAMFCRDEMMRRGVIKPIQEIKTRTNKDIRIQALQPFFERGQIIIRTGLQKLVSQLLQYPYGRLVDCVDALAMQIDSYSGIKIHKEKPKKAEKFGITLEDVLQQVHKRRMAQHRGLSTGLGSMTSPTLSTGLYRG